MPEAVSSLYSREGIRNIQVYKHATNTNAAHKKKKLILYFFVFILHPVRLAHYGFI